jgi:hypothetical protein
MSLCVFRAPLQSAIAGNDLELFVKLVRKLKPLTATKRKACIRLLCADEISVAILFAVNMVVVNKLLLIIKNDS